MKSEIQQPKVAEADAGFAAELYKLFFPLGSDIFLEWKECPHDYTPLLHDSGKKNTDVTTCCMQCRLPSVFLAEINPVKIQLISFPVLL